MITSAKKIIFILLFTVFCAGVLILGLRGLPGNPTPQSLNTPTWQDNGPLELSPERGRFALMYSVVENKSVFFSLDLARFTTPDVGFFNGKYVSLFAPAVSFIAIPGYLLGKMVGLGQVGAFAIIGLFALLNIFLIRAIAIRLGSHPWAASIAAAAVIFGTPALTYAGTLYQHHVSTFIILLASYLLLRFDDFWSEFLVWFLVALGVAVDYPNFVMMIPIGVVALSRIISIYSHNKEIKINFKPLWILTFLGVVIPLTGFLWFNNVSYGSPFRLSGTVPSARQIDANGNPATPSANAPVDPNQPTVSHEKTAIGFFQTRNILNGFYVHFISPDRGMIYFAPLFFVAVLGFILHRRKRAVISEDDEPSENNSTIIAMLVAIMGFNFLLYSMWGDPAGGWAFGSRYLIPSYAIMGIGLSFLLSRFRKNYFVVILFLGITAYSVWVNTLGAVSTSRNPPYPEILALEQVTGHEEKYTYARDIQYLNSKESKSLVYRTLAHSYMNSIEYQRALTALAFSGIAVMTIVFALSGSSRPALEKRRKE